MAGPNDLHELAVLFKDSMTAILNTLPNYDATLSGAPDRRLIYYGTPVWDCCDQLVVHTAIINEAETTPSGLDAGRRASRFARINHVRITGSITRCVTGGSVSAMGDYAPPPVSVVEAESRQHHADGWALWNLLFNLQASGDLLNLCDEVFFEGILPFAPMGGCAGWSVNVRAVLGGYEEPPGS